MITNNKRILTIIAGIIDTIIGITLIVCSILAYLKARMPQPEHLTGGEALGYGIGMALLIIFAVIGAICGIIFTIYGIIVLALAHNNGSRLSAKRKTLFVLSILEIIFAVIIILVSLFSIELILLGIILASILITTSILKIIDCKKMKNTDTLQKQQIEIQELTQIQ